MKFNFTDVIYRRIFYTDDTQGIILIKYVQEIRFMHTILLLRFTNVKISDLQ